MTNASRDQNHVTTLLAVSSVDGVTPVTLYADPVTHRLLVNGGSGGGAVSSVSNADGTLIISPTTGAVVASLNLASANIWTGKQTFNATAPTFGTMTAGSVFFAGTAGILSQDNANFFYDSSNHRLGIGTTSPSTLLHVLGTTEQLRLSYDGSNRMDTTISSTGGATISLTGTNPGYTFNTAGTGTFNFNMLSSAVSPNMFNIFAPNSSTTGGPYMNFGVSATANNCATMEFNYLSSSSASNNIAFGIAGNTAPLNVFGTKVGIGTGPTTIPSALLHLLSTTEQFRSAYDASNYASFVTSSVGALTITTTGTNPDITFTPAGAGRNVFNSNVAPFAPGNIFNNNVANVNAITTGFFAPNLIQGTMTQGSDILFGVAASNGNCGLITFSYSGGAGSSSNAMGFGIFGSSNTMYISSSRVSIGTTTQTAILTLVAGTATVNTAPLKFLSGTNTTTAEVGAVEYNGTNLFFTPTGTIRKVVPTVIVTRLTGQTAAAASVVTQTVGTTDASYQVSANVLVTTSSAENFTVTCAYTDEGNTARTVILNFSNLGGTIGSAVNFANGAVPYEGILLHIRAKAATTITIATTGTFTGATYNVEGAIMAIN